MTRIWSDEATLARMLDVELAALAGWAAVGVIPSDAVDRIRTDAKVPTPARVAELERETNHDVAAFVDGNLFDLERGRTQGQATLLRVAVKDRREWAARRLLQAGARSGDAFADIMSADGVFGLGPVTAEPVEVPEQVVRVGADDLLEFGFAGGGHADIDRTTGQNLTDDQGKTGV
jgi:hypothetical protein